MFGILRTTLNGGNFIDSWRSIVWAETANTATLLEYCIAKTGNEMSAFQQIFWERRNENDFITFAKIC